MVGGLWLILLLLGGSAYRYGECKKEGKSGTYYIWIIIYLLAILAYRYGLR
jgi:hypothetical protein